MNKRVLVLLTSFVPCIINGPLAAQEVDCRLPGRNSPAVSVPECVDSGGSKVACSTAGSIRLWPNGFQPASKIPLIRDSTDRVAGRSTPGFGSGHELFSGLDVVTVDGVSRRLYVCYNAGFQVWDIEGGNAGEPRRFSVSVRDGWEDQFLSFPEPDEMLAFILDIAALNDDATTDVIGVAGNSPVGASLWEFKTDTQQVRQLYQDTATGAKQVRMVKMNDGTIYAVVGAANGLAVYDVTAARALTEPCLDSQGSECPTVFRGFVADTAYTSKLFVDTLHVAGSDQVFVSSSGGLFTHLELWQLNDPQSPWTAVRRFRGLEHALGSALFAYDGHSYLAVVSEEAGLNQERLRIFMIDGCINGTGTCSIGTGSMEEAVNPISLQGFPTAKDFLTYSEADGQPFLYYGAGTGNLDGPDLEQLFDLSSLRPPGGSPLSSLPEITGTGGSYTDPCNGSEIRYWSHYYHSNARGLNNMVPRTGKFSSAGYFYRVAASILDVHVKTGGPPPAGIFADGFESGDVGAWTNAISQGPVVVPSGE